MDSKSSFYNSFLDQYIGFCNYSKLVLINSHILKAHKFKSIDLDQLTSFGQRLKYLREYKRFSQKKFGIETNIERSLISRYERELDIPSEYMIKKIGKALDVYERDFLISPIKQIPEVIENSNEEFDKKAFATRLKKLREAKNLSQVGLSKISGIYHGNIAKYERRYSTPDLMNIIKLADSLGVTVDLLLRGQNSNTNNRDLIDSSLIQTFYQASRCNEDEKKAIIFIIDSAIKGFRKI